MRKTPAKMDREENKALEKDKGLGVSGVAGG
jgi:hypothetical protein